MDKNNQLDGEKEKIIIDAESYVCPNCGATMGFDIKSQSFMCPACKTKGDIITVSDCVKEHDMEGYTERERRSVPFNGAASAYCDNCGTEIIFEKKQIAATCPMCSSTQIALVKQKSAIPPDGIVPFKIDKQDAQQRFRVWVKTRWFAPNDFKKTYGEGGLKAMYLPFWAYCARVSSHYTGLGGRIRIINDKDGKTRTEIDWFPTSGVVSNDFTDVQVCASDKEKKIQGILPYRLQSEAKPYSPAYLSGCYAEIYKIKADSGFETAKNIMEQTMRALAENQIRMTYDQAQVHTISSSYSNVTYKHVMLPLWTSAFGYKGKTYGYIINGETGNVAGERPYSIPKIAAAVIACAVLILAIIWATSEDTSVYSGYGQEAAFQHFTLEIGEIYENSDYSKIGDVI